MLTPFQSRAWKLMEGNAFFHALNRDRMIRVFPTFVRKGESLFEKGAPSEHLYGLVQGQLKLCLAGVDGEKLTLDLGAPGELIGSLDMIDYAPRGSSAIALTNCELATISRVEVESLLDRDPELRTALSVDAAVSARRLTARLEDAAFLKIEQRIEKSLLDLAGRFGERVERGTRIALRQQDIADILGVSRESVNKVRAAPGLRGRLELGRGSILMLGV